MDLLIIILFVLILLFCIISLIYMLIYNKVNDLIIRINEVEANIDSSLRTKYDLINRSVSIIKSNDDIKSNIFDEIVKLRSRKISNFELERKLSDAYNEFLNYKDKNTDIKDHEELTKISISLEEINEKLTILIEYYNDNISKYNKMIVLFPTNIVAKINKFNTKLFFDRKDMTDDDFKDFKL